MLIPDFSNQPYIAEVIRTSASSQDVLSAIERLLTGSWKDETILVDNAEVTIHHGFLLSSVPYHRSTRTIVNADGAQINIPRSRTVRNRDHYFYDVFVANRNRDFIVAAPFHGLAKDLFPKIDRALAGKRILYEILNITNLVVGLGTTGRLVLSGDDDSDIAIVVTRCHLAYDDPSERRRD